jgi:hypothetical protein
MAAIHLVEENEGENALFKQKRKGTLVFGSKRGRRLGDQRGISPEIPSDSRTESQQERWLK